MQIQTTTTTMPEQMDHISTKHNKFWESFQKLGEPVNKLVNKAGSEAFWPTSLDHEADKAGRILKSFCKDGFYKKQPFQTPSSSRGPAAEPEVLVKIPAQVIQNAVGLAIFTVGRIGTWGTSFSGGSGVLLARTEEGTWSPPSGIIISTLGFGFMGGIDVYDCVLVINDREALKSFQKLRMSLGGEASLTVGPVGAGGIYDSELVRGRKPVFTYVKSRGFYAGVQLDGTVIGARNDENARFYGRGGVKVEEVLAGGLGVNVPVEARALVDVVNAAEGWVEEGLPGYEGSFGDEKRQDYEASQKSGVELQEDQRNANREMTEEYPVEKTGLDELKTKENSSDEKQ